MIDTQAQPGLAAPGGPPAMRGRVGTGGSGGLGNRAGPAARHARRLACALVLAWPLWAAAASMVHGPAPESSVARELAAQVRPADAPVLPAAAEPSAEVSTLADIDLLLELQLEDADLGANPVDPPASAPQQSAVDLRSLSPGLPSNPVFPGHGLSFEPPAVNPKALLEHELLVDGGRHGDRPAPERWSRQLAGWLGLASADEGLRDRLQDFRLWVADNRVGLLVVVGGTAVLLAALVAVLRAVQRPGRAAPAPAGPSPVGRSRRRGSRHHHVHRR